MGDSQEADTGNGAFDHTYHPKPHLHKACEEWKDKAIQKCSKTKLLLDAMKKAGCPIDVKKIMCCYCDPEQGTSGGYLTESSSVVLCENGLASEKNAKETLRHELIHAFDDCRAKMNWTNCRQHACSEVRAANLSGDCRYLNELNRGFGVGKFSKHHQECVRRRAVLSLKQNPHCKDKAEAMVDDVFERCYRDHEPFGRPL